MKRNISTIGSSMTPLTLTEDDSGIILAFNTDFQSNCQSIAKVEIEFSFFI